MTMLDDLVTLICKLRLNQIQPLAIWFIDRDAEYYQLLNATDVTIEPHYLLPVYLHRVPLRQFTRSVATEEEYAARPFFCRIPGVWIEMSDGNHVWLGEQKDEDNTHHDD